MKIEFVKYSGRPLPMGDVLQDPEGMPETGLYQTLHALCFFLYMLTCDEVPFINQAQ